jgi:SAM-dependent methyltransferase
VDVVERLTLEAAQAHSLIAVEHVHRYDLAAELCRGLRVADVCCGSGYGSQILAEKSPEVLGIDNDVATIDTAQARIAVNGKLSFDVADAQEFLVLNLGERFDALVLFECLEHLREPESALEALQSHAEQGVRIILSVPNSKAFAEENPHHVTDYGYEEARSALVGFDDCVLLYQFSAEGSLIRGAETDDPTGRLILTERGELEYANHFIACINFGEELARRPDWAQMHLEAAPVHNRYLLSLERANIELRRVNARLGRSNLGIADSAAASLLAKLDRTERELAVLKERLRQKEQEAELHTWIDHLHNQIHEHKREVQAMQATRAWRLATKYWALRDGLVRRRPFTKS